MELSEACDELVEEIQKDELYPFQYSLMIMVFMQAIDDGETNKMALALATNEVKEN